jgi:hypothetical protein
MPVVKANQICLRVDAERLSVEYPDVYERVIAIVAFLDSTLLDLDS